MLSCQTVNAISRKHNKANRTCDYILPRMWIKDFFFLNITRSRKVMVQLSWHTLFSVKGIISNDFYESSKNIPLHFQCHSTWNHTVCMWQTPPRDNIWYFTNWPLLNKHRLKMMQEPPISPVYFSSVQGGIQTLRKAHKCSFASLRSFPNVAFETDLVFIW